jgi:hypothetical protein
MAALDKDNKNNQTSKQETELYSEPPEGTRTYEIMQNSPEDDELDPELAAFVNHTITQQWQDNAYIYLWGMDKITDDVYQTGTEIIKQVIKEDQSQIDNATYYGETEYNDDFLTEYEKLKLPENLCNWDEVSCFQQTIKNLDENLKFTKRHTILKTRYQEFLAFSHFSRLNHEAMNSPFPSYRTLLVGQKVSRIEMIKAIQEGHKDQVLQQINNEIQQIRTKLAQADHAVGKLVLAALLSDDIDFLFALFNAGLIEPTDLNQHYILKPLNTAEISYLKAASYEERMKLKYIMSVISVDNARPPLVEMFLPDFTAKMVKPNRLFNKLYQDQVKPVLNYLEKDGRAFHQGYEDLVIEVKHDTQTNPIGVLFNLSAEESKELFFTQQIKLYDLNMKIKLFRTVLAAGSVSAMMSPENINQNPSDYDNQLPFIKDNKLCYPSLRAINDPYNCLSSSTDIKH